jgi:hypothetical protein
LHSFNSLALWESCHRSVAVGLSQDVNKGMALHLIKLAVGAASLEEIEKFQEKRRKERKQKPNSPHRVFTRSTPKRTAELLDGGSLYWVIKGFIRARQKLVGFDEAADENGRKYCVLLVERKLIPTAARAMQPFQGWRYLEQARTPSDARAGDSADVPEEMAAELRRLGLI